MSEMSNSIVTQRRLAQDTGMSCLHHCIEELENDFALTLSSIPTSRTLVRVHWIASG
jgi:hypothetical protein